MLILFLLIAHTSASEVGEDRIACDGLIFDKVYFEKEVLFSNLGRPYNLVMHKFSGALFFSQTIQNATNIDFGITFCHIDRRKCKKIEGVPGGYAIAYDSGNDDLYFGGHNGIYQFNFLTKKADFFAEEGKSIWGLFVKRNFYYIEYPSQSLYVYENDAFVIVAEARDIEVDHFFISKHNDIYFSNKTALFKVEKGTKTVILLDDELIIRQIIEDGYGDVYFVASNGIYLEDKPYHRVKRVAAIDQAFGLTFDEEDRVVYSDKNAIYRLHPSQYNDLCYQVMSTLREAEGKYEEDSLRLAKAILNKKN